MRVVTAVLLLAALLGAPGAVLAAEARASFSIIGNDRLPAPARTPSVIVGGDPRIQLFDRPRRGAPDRPVVSGPQVVVVSPGQCWQPGYWTYQWVPQSYSYTTFVPGQWSPDGSWIAGHYEPAVYSTGYYQPLWVEGYWTGC
jgi:hypothetical protein